VIYCDVYFPRLRKPTDEAAACLCARKTQAFLPCLCWRPLPSRSLTVVAMVTILYARNNDFIGRIDQSHA